MLFNELVWLKFFNSSYTLHNDTIADSIKQYVSVRLFYHQTIFGMKWAVMNRSLKNRQVHMQTKFYRSVYQSQ